MVEGEMMRIRETWRSMREWEMEKSSIMQRRMAPQYGLEPETIAGIVVLMIQVVMQLMSLMSKNSISVKHESRLENDTVVSKSEGVEFIVKDGFFCPAIAKAVKTMKKSEKVLLTVKPQCKVCSQLSKFLVEPCSKHES